MLPHEKRVINSHHSDLRDIWNQPWEDVYHSIFVSQMLPIPLVARL